MNIHEHQAKQILKEFGVEVPNGIFALTVDDLIEKAKQLNTDKYVLKAQIHAGGRGKAGGIKILNNIDELIKASKELLGKKLITPQTGREGREVKRLYVEESSTIEKEFYLSCLVDRASSKIAFISSDQGGMDIEEVAKNKPEKIITTKLDFSKEVSDDDCEKIIKIFNKIKSEFLSKGYKVIVIPSMRTPKTSIELANKEMGASGYVAKNVDKQAYLSAYALAKYVVVTCDSTSMISEAAISGKPIFVAHMKSKRNNYRFKKFFELFKTMGIIRDLGEKIETWTYKKHNEATRIATIIKGKIKN